MQEPFFIKKVAVLGAGVMGAQIAAHCVNAGIETLLFDLSTDKGPPNALIDKAIVQLQQLKPSPLATKQSAKLLQARNYKEDLQDLVSCDLIIEAIAERLDWKEDLYKRISPYLAPGSILVSNTSGLSINALAQVLPEQHRAHFCGLHFFNPPRYMHLAELIPSQESAKPLLDHLETWLTSYLGKGVVRAKDTPNFIANRIGVFSLLATLYHTETMEMGLDEVDLLTGVLLGRPKSASFRTMDVVGLDTLAHVVHTMEKQLQKDPWYPYFKLPEWMSALIEQGALGQKTGQGLYRKKGSELEVYDLKLAAYRPIRAEVSQEFNEIMKVKDPALRMQQLNASQNKQAQFIAACFRDLFHYCAYHLEEIAEQISDVDLALRWGFGWMQGPFETWQEAGVQSMIQLIQAAIKDGRSLSTAPLPGWLYEIEAFYTEQGSYAPEQRTYRGKSSLPVYQRQLDPVHLVHTPQKRLVLYENEGVRLWHLKDEVAVLGFKSKSNTIGQAVLDGMLDALSKAEQQCKGLIIYQHDAAHFSSGADLRAVLLLIQQHKMQALERMITQFQQVVMRLKYSSIPTVAALRGRALGGGCEIILHCAAIVAAFESYPGLVELGVGLIPAGGGCKEMALRAAAKAGQADLLLFVQPYFQQIATGQVAGSAPEARQMGYLRDQDSIIMHADEVLYAALAKINAMQALNYVPPLAQKFKISGLEGHARLEAGLANWLKGGFISEHDFLLANELAAVLCGGNLNEGTLVDEHWLLTQERRAFIQLAETALTEARIQHLLETGKPLRN